MHRAIDPPKILLRFAKSNKGIIMEKKIILHMIEWEIKDYPWAEFSEEYAEMLLNSSIMEEARQVIAKAMEK
jgi:hypothetical protein